ncbi:MULTISPECIES: dihydrolipoamide acetyltransferase family protein [unclassified Nocardioides]|uniref:dihydrolipoamide acetyltransferase family protein n=1 Tax=unclassified Nocardioides TaxID=2615069 RepID=UPI0009F00D86|nr:MULTISPECIES: dihydrolipoamide acetyltransferase family protein [unclassified Nocardioides]GAW47941.1 Pyruvate dehydrogenase complex dihydrolipoamide acetyltransferase [Nocardioides sp. PD653-B2]GAW53756.1 Pyruvate dehydrogenase complex dihydrolipoamide acetyltransferase [Nocardioides sp. PD653]
MATIMRMPELAANTPEATLVAWLVQEGAEVQAGDPVATVETAKATVDVEAEVSGTVLRLTAEEGDDVTVGRPIIVIGSKGETVDESRLSDSPEPQGASLQSAGAVHAPDVDTALDTKADTKADTKSPVERTDDDLAPDSAPGLSPVPSATREASDTVGARIFASPLARKMARDAGLELTQLTGTGPNGRIRRRDVEAALSSVATSSAESAQVVAADGQPGPSGEAAVVRTAVPTGWTDIPNSKLRKAIATRLTESKQTAPHFYLRGTANVDPLLELRARLNTESGTRVSVNDLIVKAVAKAHQAVPLMNVTWGSEAIRQYEHVDIAIAVATERGLVTPVVRNAETLSLTALAEATRDFARRARDGALRPDELDGGSISVSNLGMFETEEFAAIINPPQAAILAVGAAKHRPVVIDGELAIARTLKVTLSVDHRPVDGATAAEWMREFLGLLERPLRLVV